MTFFKKIIQKIKALFQRKSEHELLERIARMERNHIVLLKRILEMDGIQLRTAAFSSKVLQTPSEELKGLNDPEPTIH